MNFNTASRVKEGEILAQQESFWNCQGIYVDIRDYCVVTSSLAAVPKWKLCFPSQGLNYEASVPQENHEEQVPIQETTE